MPERHPESISDLLGHVKAEADPAALDRGDVSSGGLTVLGSTIAGNTACTAGGAIYTFGSLSLVNSTLANNQALVGGAMYASGTVGLVNSTVSGNIATSGGKAGGSSAVRPSRTPSWPGTMT